VTETGAWLRPTLANELTKVETPAFVIDLAKLRANCEVLQSVQQQSGAKILLALKGFAAWSTFSLLREYLVGTAASGPYEARLGAEIFGGEVHVYAPAFTARDMEECLEVCHHVVFNSPSEWKRHRARCLEAKQSLERKATASVARELKFGLRINPEHSEVATPLYDPCRPGSRLGATRQQVQLEDLVGLSGLHFHTLCELGADALERTLRVVEEKWADVLPELDWVNFGGGHHITRVGYDVDRLVRLVKDFQSTYGVQVYLEPGEAVALDAGVLVASVLDVIENQGTCAILDVSATAHMPDVLEMPYRPTILGPNGIAGAPGEFAHDVRLGGLTCLAGDEIGSYSFAQPLVPGDRLIFRDMAIYSMVKTTMFNGVRHPDIVLCGEDGELKLQRRFGYPDYRDRLS
jgi:carboxynorspermidine decarboxylase